MKRKILDILIFLRLVNGDDNLSLSNIAVIVMIVQIALSKQIDFAAAAALLAVIGGYNYKRYITKGEKSEEVPVKPISLDDLIKPGCCL